MGGIDTNYRKEGFFKITWKEILAGVLSFIVLGAVSFVFANFTSRLAEVEAKATQLDITYKTEVVNKLSNITVDLGKTADKMTSIDTTTHDLEIAVGKLQVLVERLGK